MERPGGISMMTVARNTVNKTRKKLMINKNTQKSEKYVLRFVLIEQYLIALNVIFFLYVWGGVTKHTMYKKPEESE